MKHTILRAALLILTVAAGFLLQTNLGRWIPFLTVAPNLLLIITFSIGFLRGKTEGMLTGLLCGLLLDSLDGGVFGHYTLILLYIGYLNGLLGRVFVNDMIFLPLILCAAAEFFYSLYSYLTGAFLFGHTNVGDYLRTIALPELIETLIFAVLLYGILMAVVRRLQESEKEKEDLTKFA